MSEALATAVLTALNARLPAGRDAYDYDQIPTTRPDDYIEVTVSRRFGGEPRASGRFERTGFRITARAVSKTVSNARTLHALAAEALEYVALTVGADVSTPLMFESEEPIGPDDGWYSGMRVFTCSL